MGIGRPIFASDYMGVFKSMGNKTYDLSPLGALFWEANAQMALAFLDSQIISMPCDCNKPAHVLAGLGASGNFGLNYIWVDEAPNFVSSAMSGDSTVLKLME